MVADCFEVLMSTTVLFKTVHILNLMYVGNKNQSKKFQKIANYRLWRFLKVKQLVIADAIHVYILPSR